jgi:hypothetical protein
MEFNEFPRPLREAIVAIAETNAELHVATSITAGDCEEYAQDVDVVMAFWALQTVNGSAAETWGDLFEKLTDNERTQIVAAIAVGHPAGLRVLRDALQAHISEWLAHEAETYQETMERSEPPPRPGYYAELAQARHVAVITGTGNAAQRRELNALCAGLRRAP